MEIGFENGLHCKGRTLFFLGSRNNKCMWMRNCVVLVALLILVAIIGVVNTVSTTSPALKNKLLLVELTTSVSDFISKYYCGWDSDATHLVWGAGCQPQHWLGTLCDLEQCPFYKMGMINSLICKVTVMIYWINTCKALDLGLAHNRSLININYNKY